MPEYQLSRHSDNMDEHVLAEHLNQLQRAIEELAGSLKPSFVAGQRYGSDTLGPGGSTATAPASANLLYACPFWTGPNGCVITNLNIDVSTSVAGNARLGIYAAKTEPPTIPPRLCLMQGRFRRPHPGRKHLILPTPSTSVRYRQG